MLHIHNVDSLSCSFTSVSFLNKGPSYTESLNQLGLNWVCWLQILDESLLFETSLISGMILARQ